MDVWAVVPVKETGGAKERLAAVAPSALRRRLALAMFEDVLAALAGVPELAGVLVVTADPDARLLARRYGARAIETGARDGHTGAVTAAAKLLVAEKRAAMLTIPGDVPLASADRDFGAVGGAPPGPLLYDRTIA